MGMRKNLEKGWKGIEMGKNNTGNAGNRGEMGTEWQKCPKQQLGMYRNVLEWSWKWLPI